MTGEGGGGLWSICSPRCKLVLTTKYLYCRLGRRKGGGR